MPNHHHATPRDWALVIDRSQRAFSEDSCIVELRGRIEALEAAQHAHVNYAPAKPEHQDKLDRLIEQDRSDDRQLTLVERVARRLANFASESLPGDDALPIASDVLRDVARWLAEGSGRSGAWSSAAADLLDNEVNR